MSNGAAPSSTSTVCLLTRFRAVDDQAAKQVTDALRTVADGIAAEPGHATYDVFAVDGDPTLLYVLETWASAADADRHARRVVDDGSVDRVLPLLGERLETMTLTTVASKHVEGAAA